jgi:hypothetical protein
VIEIRYRISEVKKTCPTSEGAPPWWDKD